MDPERDIVARVALACAAGLTRLMARRSIERAGSAERALRTLGADAAAHERAARAHLEVAARAGIRALVPGRADFPAVLAAIPDPPLVLWARGTLPFAPMLAIVGARRASARGLATARSFAEAIARAGVAIVSGLAYGIDAAAHAGALDGGGATVAVLGSGADRITPVGQRTLGERILASGGGFLSEHPPGAPARSHHFPERNRLISGLAAATLVVEARERSGSLWSARHALEQGRDVLVVPGPIDSDQCRGTNRLLRDGATPVLEPADALAAVLGPLAPRLAMEPEPVAADGEAARLLALLADGPCAADDAARALGLAPAELAALVVPLELDGRIERAGTRLSRVRLR